MTRLRKFLYIPPGIVHGWTQCGKGKPMKFNQVLVIAAGLFVGLMAVAVVCLLTLVLGGGLRPREKR